MGPAPRQTGAEVTVLEALEDYPDAVFVEDSAVCLPEGAVIMRPGAPSRLGEAAEMAPVVQRLYGEVQRIDGAGFIEGGDILTTEREILVGLSARTDRAGVEEFTRYVTRWGYTVRVVDTPPGCFAGDKVIHAAEGEEAGANSIRFNDTVIMPSGFPRTRDALDVAGYKICEIGNSEAAKLDGGLSCLSLRFSPGAK